MQKSIIRNNSAGRETDASSKPLKQFIENISPQKREGVLSQYHDF